MILVTGAAGVVGQPLLAELRNRDLPYIAISRNKDANGYVIWNLDDDLNEATKARLQGCKMIVHCAPLWLLPRHIDAFVQAGISKVIAFSSTSVIAKRLSDDLQEQTLVDKLSESEAALKLLSREHGFALTVFRSAMIYGYGLDQNVSHIARQINKLGFMPIAGSAKGLRQPVHADDLVAAVMIALDRAQTPKEFYTLAGGEELTYRDMIARIFLGLGKKPRFLRLPVFLYRLILILATRITGFAYRPNMANRMNVDLVYDISDAQQDVEFTPQLFLQNSQRDLVL